MSIGITSNTFHRQSPHLNKPENRQTVNNIEEVDNTTKADSTKSQGVINKVRDRSISDGENLENPLGISYRLGKDEAGNKIIIFDPPMPMKKTDQTDSTQNQEQDKKLFVAESKPDNSKKDYGKQKILTATTDTSKVDAEIKKLKEKKQQIQQEIRSVRNDENKRKNLEVRLAQIETELRAKDNDAYRRQNGAVTFNK